MVSIMKTSRHGLFSIQLTYSCRRNGLRPLEFIRECGILPFLMCATASNFKTKLVATHADDIKRLGELCDQFQDTFYNWSDCACPQWRAYGHTLASELQCKWRPLVGQRRTDFVAIETNNPNNPETISTLFCVEHQILRNAGQGYRWQEGDSSTNIRCPDCRKWQRRVETLQRLSADDCKCWNQFAAWEDPGVPAIFKRTSKCGVGAFSLKVGFCEVSGLWSQAYRGRLSRGEFFSVNT